MSEKDDGVVDVMGHVFRRVKSGLDESQVIPFIKQLIDERDTLVGRQEHLSSLTRLYERTVAEADELAKQIRKEAEEKNQAESEAIIAKTEEEAKQMLEETRAEALAMAQAEAEAVKASAQEQSAEMLRERTQKLQSQLTAIARLLYEATIAQAEMLKQQAGTFEEDFENKLSELVQWAGEASMEDESDGTPDIDSGVNTQAVTQADTLDKTDTSEIEQTPRVFKPDSKENGQEEWIELEILPPKDKDEIEKIKVYLEGKAEVKTVELITLSDRTLVEVCLSKPMNLMDTLRKLPEVKQVKEVVDGEDEKIQITLNMKSNLEITKDALNTEVQRIFSGRHASLNTPRVKGHK
jgi:cell division septum initiation protein DivIVA